MGDLEKALRAQYERGALPTFKPGQLGHGIESAPTPDYLGRAPATPEQIRCAINGEFQEQQAETVFKDKDVARRNQLTSGGRTPDQDTGIVHSSERRQRQRQNQKGYRNGRRGHNGGR